MNLLLTQGLEAVKWRAGKCYALEEFQWCEGLTVTAGGEVVIWTRTRAEWYSKQGKLIQTLPLPSGCRNDFYLGILAVEVGGKQGVALCSSRYQCIWLGSPEAEAGGWGIAWQATGEEGSKERVTQPKPYRMCRGKPGQIIALNGWQGEEQTVSIFDITQVPFEVVIQEIKLRMNAEYLCYVDFPGRGSGLAVTNAYDELCMFSLPSGAPLWSVGGRQLMKVPVVKPDTSGPGNDPFLESGGREEERVEYTKVAGAEWLPNGVCSDNRGRLYVADGEHVNHRIIVFSAHTGSVLQVVQGTGHLWGRHWVVEPGITVYAADIEYMFDMPEKGVASGTVLQAVLGGEEGGEECQHDKESEEDRKEVLKEGREQEREEDRTEEGGESWKEEEVREEEREKGKKAEQIGKEDEEEGKREEVLREDDGKESKQEVGKEARNEEGEESGNKDIEEVRKEDGEEKKTWMLPLIKVNSVDLPYVDDEPEQEVVLGSESHESSNQQKLGLPVHVCWHEPSKSLVVYHSIGMYQDRVPYINYFQLEL